MLSPNSTRRRRHFLCLKPRSPSPCTVGWSWSPSTVPIGRQCSEDVSGDVAHELRRQCDLRLREGRFHLQEFAERHEGLFHNIQLPLPVPLVSLSVSGQEARWVRRPSGDRWIHEIKFDGYRVQVNLANNEIKVFTRRGNEWTHRFKNAGHRFQIKDPTMKKICSPQKLC